MVFVPPSCVSELPHGIPDDVLIPQLMLDDRHNYGRCPLKQSKTAYVDAITGKEYSIMQVKNIVTNLSRAFDKLLGVGVHANQWEKVICVFAPNDILTLPVAWGLHLAGGVVSAANAAYSPDELAHQLRDSYSRFIIAHSSTLDVAKKAAKQAGIPNSSIFTFDDVPGHKTIQAFIEEGAKLPPISEIRLKPGEGITRTAFLCYSSGTTGLPKGVMISHRNVMANVLQFATFEQGFVKPASKVILGLLPFSHIYSLVVVNHIEIYRGNTVIVLPKYTPDTYCDAMEKYKINTAYLVPPLIIQMLKNPQVKDRDFSSMDMVFSGAAPLSAEVSESFRAKYSHTALRQGYGMTETCTVVCSTHPSDIINGSSGYLLPSIEARLVTTEGKEVTEMNKPGELWVRSPSNVIGYLNNTKATKETITDDGWLKTGDEAEIRLSPKGFQHVFVLERIKELIKVKGMQVAPAELEATLLSHPKVEDAAVIPVKDDYADEIPKAFCVVSKPSEELRRDIYDFVAKQKAHYKHLKGGIEFIEVIPKSPSGKILRRLLRDQEKAKTQKAPTVRAKL